MNTELKCVRCDGPKLRARGSTCAKCSKLVYRERNKKLLAQKARAAYSKDPAKARKRVAKWRKTHRDWERKYYKARYQAAIDKSPEALKAKNAVMAARRSGQLVNKPCAICGKKKTDAHHSSYAPEKHLDVMFLCRAHHRAWHRVFIAEGAQGN